MSAPSVRLEHVAKRFMIPHTQRTTLRVVKALLRREALRHELWALEDVSFALQPGERLALVGRNGSGTDRIRSADRTVGRMRSMTARRSVLARSASPMPASIEHLFDTAQEARR